ncbi:hypothetical protein Terro_0905 [Terriglobus roseus DSM 18391]|uniref:DoxX-like family protein n=1 Tax=Terriglobus roseus (strain DSM 18391 / NRRL B-41598 / KBS 63) TaxID=926566 RepID=I3ZDB3_TERRK|nr:DoxX family protein [Terriglobus roseus]AFL87231.1 hypothetical protein Terro_0905 [Terriglobus roseus DSM 18391]
MKYLPEVAQVVIAASVIYVWTVNYRNVVKEFEEYELPERVRTFVGATKISLSTLLVAGIWYPRLALIPAALMALLMVCAILAHLRVHHAWHRSMPAFVLLLLCLFVVAHYAWGVAL